jgi:DNA-binding XRE family transcriptional regulator
MESETVHAMRIRLGRKLAELRKAKGYTQRSFAPPVGYSRTAVSSAEMGRPDVSRQFFERCDEVLTTGEQLAGEFDRIRARIFAEARETAGLAKALEKQSLEVGTIAGALRAFAEAGWPAGEHDGRLEVVTGTVVDALEVPRQAGTLALAWWRYTGGLADQVRGLPALPPPEEAAAVVDAGPAFYFLARAGECPWSDPAKTASCPKDIADEGWVRWHANGGRIPVPPGPDSAGLPCRWAQMPAGTPRLASALALLDLLAKAAAVTRHGRSSLHLPGGVLIVPAPSEGDGTWPPR